MLLFLVLHFVSDVSLVILLLRTSFRRTYYFIYISMNFIRSLLTFYFILFFNVDLAFLF